MDIVCVFVWFLRRKSVSFPSQQREMYNLSGERTISERQNKNPNYRSGKHKHTTATLLLVFLPKHMFLIIPYFLCHKLLPKRKSTKEHENVVTERQRNQNEGIESIKSDKSFISLSLTLITQAEFSQLCNYDFSCTITAKNNSCHHLQQNNNNKQTDDCSQKQEREIKRQR